MEDLNIPSPQEAAISWRNLPDRFSYAVTLRADHPKLARTEKSMTEQAAEFITALNLTIGPTASLCGLRLEEDAKSGTWDLPRYWVKPRYSEINDLPVGMHQTAFINNLGMFLHRPEVEDAARGVIAFDVLRSIVKQTPAALKV